MSAKKRRGAKKLRDEAQKGSSLEDVDSPDLSAIERASFLEGLQANYGNPLHSTAMEEDLNVLESGQANKGKAGREEIPQMLKTAGKQRGATAKRKEAERVEENEREEEEEEKTKTKRSRKSSGGKVKARPENKGETKKKKGAPQRERAEVDVKRTESDPSADQPPPTASKLKKLVGKKPAKARRAEQKSAGRPMKNQPVKKGKKRESESGRGNSSDPQSKDESDTDTTEQRRKRVLLSDEEVVDEDTSWKPSPKKARLNSLGRTRKSSSDRSRFRTSSSETEKTNRDEQRRKRHGGRGATEFDVVLDAFLDFCEQYRESVGSKAVKQSIDSFSSNVKEQLLEKISSYKELKALKRENVKVGSLIHKKRRRMLDAKHELMRAERQVWLLQKKNTELELRLTDLRRGQAFLYDIRELNRQYLDHRHKHPTEKETYGASSLPALLLEAKHIQTAEHQLRGINNRLEKRLKENGK